MLRAHPPIEGAQRIAADGQSLPFQAASFDAVFCINVLEHVPSPKALVAETARVLRAGGCFLAVTPNGDLEWLLDLLEACHLKLPEGPHHFLGRTALQALASGTLHIEHYRRFLAFPAGPDALVRTIDRLCASGSGWGLFHYILMRKAEAPA